jgi:DNA-binding protein HU-beta
MNKTELVKKVAAENELNQKQAAAVVDSVLGAVVDTVAAGEAVALFGFGTFSLKHRDARQGRNPATGEAMEFAASNTPVFKPAKVFKDKVNKPRK